MNRFVGITLALVMAMSCASPIHSPAAPSATIAKQQRADLIALDGYIRGQTDAGRFSGVVLVAEGDEIVFDRGYGAIDPRAETAAVPGPNTLFNLASVGKMFTATAILQQVGRGRLSLNTRLIEVMPDYCNRRFAETVTIRDLLTHSDGIGGIDLFEVENAANRQNARTPAEMVALHHCREPAFTPGERTAYDNFGFVILGRVLEIVSGERFEDYLVTHIFAPADMNDTLFLDCEVQMQRSDLARGFTEIDGRTVSNCAKMPIRGFPAGGQWSTARDMFRFTKALRDGTLLPPDLFAQATTIYRQGFGLGFFATGYGPQTPIRDFRWGHGGQGYQITNDVRVYPRTGETIVVMSNSDGPAVFQIADFLHRLAQEQGRAPLPPPGTELPG